MMTLEEIRKDMMNAVVAQIELKNAGMAGSEVANFLAEKLELYFGSEAIEEAKELLKSRNQGS